MLAKENRLRLAEDFRVTMKTGRKQSSQSLVLYLKRDSGLTQSRFGFIVAKTVGGAVTRNLVKRRLREIARVALNSMPVGIDVVVRALPSAGAADWNKLCSDFEIALAKGIEAAVAQ